MKEENKTVEYAYIPVNEEPEMGLNIVKGENPDHLVEAYYQGNGKWVITDSEEEIDISDSVTHWLKKVPISSLVEAKEDDLPEDYSDLAALYYKTKKSSQEWCDKAMETAKQLQEAQKAVSDLRKQNIEFSNRINQNKQQ